MAIVRAAKPPKLKLTTLDIELAVADHFNYRENLIVPNVSWGLGFSHELDVMILKPSGYAWEVEIKIDKSDLKNDLNKIHGHHSNKIRRVYFALPDNLVECALEILPERFGILNFRTQYFQKHGAKQKLQTIRVPKENRQARRLTEQEIKHLYELASMRTWTLKRKLAKQLKK